MKLHPWAWLYRMLIPAFLLLIFSTGSFGQKNADGTYTYIKPDGTALTFQHLHPGANKVVDTFSVQSSDGSVEMFFRERDELRITAKLRPKSVSAGKEAVKMTNNDGTVAVYYTESPVCNCEIDTMEVEQPDGSFMQYYMIRSGNKNILKKEMISNAGKEKESADVYENADEMPAFRSGKTDLVNFIKKNIRFKNNGKRYVGSHNISFIVLKNGKIVNIKMDEEYTIPPPALRKEIIRVLQTMPAWKPGKVDGKPANVYYTLQMNLVI